MIRLIRSSRLHALEEALAVETRARKSAERAHAAANAELRALVSEVSRWFNAYWGEAGEAIAQRERAEKAEDTIRRIREGVANCAQPSGDSDIAATLGQIILLKDALLVASEHATDGWREQYRALYEQIVDRALDALGFLEHDQIHQGLRDALVLDPPRDVSIESRDVTTP